LTFPEVIESVVVDETTDTAQITYTFSTAWAPPTAWQEAASSRYPDLTFALGWEESGCDFWGAQVLQDGDILNFVEGACSDFCPEDVDWDDLAASCAALMTQTEETWEKIQEIMEEGLTSA
jgi:DNA-binding ferritin-like protein (Dps family)